MAKQSIKKFTAILLAVILAFSVFTLVPITASAATEYSIGDFVYIILDDGTAEIKRYWDPAVELTELKIPGELNGYTVTSIGDGAFSSSYSLTSITIPDSVTSIGDWAFSSCYSLTSITIPDSVASIGASAFRDCEMLTSITIPDSVASIGASAFRYCEMLTSITIPDSVTSIGEYAFSGCKSLENITVDNNNANYASVDGILFNKDKTILIAYPASKPDENYTTPDSVTSIGEYAFAYCTSLESITIPDSVTSIGKSTFAHCESLTSITIPDSVTSIGDRAFSDCTSLTSITIPNSVTSIGKSTFCNCESLESITIPYSVTSIGSLAFGYCTSLTSINTDDNNANYTSVDGIMFNKDKTVLVTYPAGKPYENYTIPDSVTTIGNYSFVGCYSLTSISIPDSVTTIGDMAFSDCTSLTSITIPNSVTSIGKSTFCNCESLESVKIGNSVTSIGSDVFKYCTNLTSISIPDSVTSIGASAFRYCERLTSITIPDSVRIIGYSAFEFCSSLTDVYYSGSKDEWNKILFGDFNNDLKYATIHFNSEGPLPAETIVDENTGISVTTNSAAEINVEILTDSDSAKNVITLLDKSEKLADLYDISLTKGGVSVQPDEPATVKIPTDNENAKVYRIEDNGTTTDMNAVYDNGYMVFTTEHFSLYALVVSSGNIMGDVNFDGIVSIDDATEIQKYLAELKELNSDQEIVADVNSDGIISIDDVTQIQKYLAELTPSLG